MSDAETGPGAGAGAGHQPGAGPANEGRGGRRGLRERVRAFRYRWAVRREQARATVPGRIGGAVVVLLLAAVLVVGVLAPPEHCPNVTQGDLRASATAAVGWFAHNQRADGRWLYLYDRRTGEEDAEPYNIVRHAGAIAGLEMAATAGIPRARETADRGTAWILDHTMERGDWTAVSYAGETEVGSSALLVAGLAERRATTGDPAYDDVMRRLGRFMQSQVEPSGAVLGYYDISNREPLAGVYSKYYTGEAYWALARLHRLFPDEGWGETADRIGDYLATERDHAEGHRLAIPDHWAAYGLAETAGAPAGPGFPTLASDPGGRPLTPGERAYARHQAGVFGAQVRWFAQLFGPWGVPTRGFQGVPRGGGYGVVGEGLSGLWRVSREEPKLADLEGPVAERALCNAGQAIEAQATAEDAASDDDPGRVEGAWFRDGVTRMDDQQHALAGILRAEAIAEAGPAERHGPAPAAWLWLLALVAALNPLRVALATRTPSSRWWAPPDPDGPEPPPAEGPTPAGGALGGGRGPTTGTGAETGSVPAASTGTAIATATAPPGDTAGPATDVAGLGDVAVGAAVGALCVLVAALAAGHLAGWAHISPPALRIAASALAAGSGLAAVFTPPSSATPIVGRGGAIVPVAVAVAHPALVLMAVSAAVDRGLPIVVVALVTGLAALVAGVAAGRQRVLVWGGRLAGAVLVVTAVLLIFNAIYSP